MITITTSGFPEAIDALHRLSDQLIDTASEGLTEGMLPLVTDRATYPVRESSYVRTGNLGIGWASFGVQITPYQNGVMGTADNPNVPYTHWVQGDPDGYAQAKVHEGYWVPSTLARDNFMPSIIDRINQRFDDLTQELFI
jgi:hypothetical protein